MTMNSASWTFSSPLSGTSALRCMRNSSLAPSWSWSPDPLNRLITTSPLSTVSSLHSNFTFSILTEVSLWFPTITPPYYLSFLLSLSSLQSLTASMALLRMRSVTPKCCANWWNPLQRPLRILCESEHYIPEPVNHPSLQALKRRKMHKSIGNMGKVTEYLDPWLCVFQVSRHWRRQDMILSSLHTEDIRLQFTWNCVQTDQSMLWGLWITPHATWLFFTILV